MLESTIFNPPQFKTLVTAKDEENYCPKTVTHLCILGSLNHRLALSKQISVAAVKKLIALHNHLSYDVYPFATKLSPQHDRLALQEIGRYVQEIEFAMQDLWGFTQDSAFHTHYCKIPHCTCNKNGTDPYFFENWGIDAARHNDCPVHGINSDLPPLPHSQ